MPTHLWYFEPITSNLSRGLHRGRSHAHQHSGAAEGEADNGEPHCQVDFSTLSSFFVRALVEKGSFSDEMALRGGRTSSNKVVTCLEAQDMGYDFVTRCSRCDYYLNCHFPF